MRKPARVSNALKNRFLERIAQLAQKEELDSKDEVFLAASSIYQYELDELPNNEIILTEEVYIRLLGLATCSNFFESYKDEFGCYLFGTSLGNNRFLFHSIGKNESNPSSCEFETTEEMANEIVMQTRTRDVDCVCHVHTHPNSDENYSSTPSNQDLYVYAWFNEQFMESKKKIYYLGALITPTEASKDSFNDICFIFYDKDNKKFYKATNICYYSGMYKNKLKKESYKQKRNNKVESVEDRVVLLKENDI